MELLIALGAKYSYLLVLMFCAIAFLLLPNKTKRQVFVLSLFAVPIAFIFSKIADKLFENPRPFVVEKIQPLIPHAANNGFPSDHTLIAAVAAAIIFTYNKKWGMILFILAFASGYFRVLAKVHHLTDILGSIVIAAAATHIAWHILRIVILRSKAT